MNETIGGIGVRLFGLSPRTTGSQASLRVGDAKEECSIDTTVTRHDEKTRRNATIGIFLCLGVGDLNEQFFYQSAVVDKLDGTTAGFVEDLMRIDAKFGIERRREIFRSIDVLGCVVAF